MLSQFKVSPPAAEAVLSTAMEHASSSGPRKSVSPALTFEVLATQGRARVSRMTLPHFTAETPMFMPVGTQGSHLPSVCLRAQAGLLPACPSRPGCPGLPKDPACAYGFAVS